MSKRSEAPTQHGSPNRVFGVVLTPPLRRELDAIAATLAAAGASVNDSELGRLLLHRGVILTRVALGQKVEADCSCIARARIATPGRRYDYDGESLTLSEWATRFGLSRQALHLRLQKTGSVAPPTQKKAS